MYLKPYSESYKVMVMVNCEFETETMIMLKQTLNTTDF